MPLLRRLPLLLVAAGSATVMSCGGDSTRPLPAQNPTLVTTVTPTGTTMYAGDSLIIALDASDSTSVRTIPLSHPMDRPRRAA
ncbi:MAG: hypothetical protein ABIQ10_16220 [Gemmatimonadaceae bacterium]